MSNVKIQGKIPCSDVGKRTKITDIIEYTLKQKLKWARHVATMKDNRYGLSVAQNGNPGKGKDQEDDKA